MTDFNMDAMLDGVLDDLADAPEFRPFPAGTHKVTITILQKKIGTHPAFEVGMKAIETIELSNSEDTPLTAGATSSTAYDGYGDWPRKLQEDPCISRFPLWGEIKS